VHVSFHRACEVFFIVYAAGMQLGVRPHAPHTHGAGSRLNHVIWVACDRHGRLNHVIFVISMAGGST